MALKVALYIGFMVFLIGGLVLKSGSSIWIGLGVALAALAIFIIANTYKLITHD